jgi:hypothetical protein
MIRFCFFILVFVSTPSFGQNLPYYNLQVFPPEYIQHHDIEKLEGYYFRDDSVYRGGTSLQEIRHYNEKGYLKELINVMRYSDIGAVHRVLEYDSLNRITCFQKYMGDSLQREEHFAFEAQYIQSWMLDITATDHIDLIKRYKFLSPDRFFISYGLDGEIVQTDQFLILENPERRIQMVTRDDGVMYDSTYTFLNRGDTLEHSLIYLHDTKRYIKTTVNSAIGHISRKRVYSAEGDFEYAQYWINRKNSTPYMEKTIHSNVVFNVERKYDYDAVGLPLSVDIYRNGIEKEGTRLWLVTKREEKDKVEQ